MPLQRPQVATHPGALSHSGRRTQQCMQAAGTLRIPSNLAELHAVAKQGHTVPACPPARLPCALDSRASGRSRSWMQSLGKGMLLHACLPVGFEGEWQVTQLDAEPRQGHAAARLPACRFRGQVAGHAVGCGGRPRRELPGGA